VILDAIQTATESALSERVELRPVSDHEAQILVPFYFSDGDGLVIHVRVVDGRWELTDKANTLLNLSYHSDASRLRTGTRSRLLEEIKLRHGVEEHDGELRLATSRDGVGRSVFSFVQALLEITDLRHFDRDNVRSTFHDDVAALLCEAFPAIVRNYIDPEHDKAGNYPIPYVLNGTSRPVAVFDIGSDPAAATAVVIARQHKAWHDGMVLVAVEEKQEALNRKRVAWLSDAFDKQFPSLSGSEDDLVAYLDREWKLSQRISTLP
jgi:hypothetical protein